MHTKGRPRSVVRLRGTVLGFNVDSRGSFDGVLVETAAGVEQINFPKHSAATFGKTLQAGATFDVNVELVADDGDHPVYRASDEVAEVAGRVVRLNHNASGHVNGYHLDTGAALHVKPAAARKLGLLVGSAITATGTLRRGPDAVVLHVHSIERVEMVGNRHDPGLRTAER